MSTDPNQKRTEAQKRIAQLRIDISRLDTDTVCMSGEGSLTTGDLEALLYLMRESPDWHLGPEEEL